MLLSTRIHVHTYVLQLTNVQMSLLMYVYIKSKLYNDDDVLMSLIYIYEIYQFYQHGLLLFSAEINSFPVFLKDFEYSSLANCN